MKHTTSTQIDVTKENGKATNDRSKSSEEFNNFFIILLTLQLFPEDSYLKDTIYLSNSVKIKTADKTALLKNISADRLKKNVTRLWTTKFMEQWKYLSGKVPRDLKLSDLIPVFKKEDSTLLSNEY